MDPRQAATPVVPIREPGFAPGGAHHVENLTLLTRSTPGAPFAHVFAMARALWKGVIEFGAVSVPVKLYTAVRPQGIAFNMLHDQDLVRVRQQMVCPAHSGGEKDV